jgi:hypothetical protein
MVAAAAVDADYRAAIQEKVAKLSLSSAKPPVRVQGSRYTNRQMTGLSDLTDDELRGMVLLPNAMNYLVKLIEGHTKRLTRPQIETILTAWHATQPEGAPPLDKGTIGGVTARLGSEKDCGDTTKALHGDYYIALYRILSQEEEEPQPKPQKAEGEKT